MDGNTDKDIYRVFVIFKNINLLEEKFIKPFFAKPSRVFLYFVA